MPIKSEDAEREAVLEAARVMLATARTAPKARGLDQVVTTIVIEDVERDALADAMISLKETWPMYERDADNVKKSSAIILIGVKGLKSKGLNCGACGFQDCEDYDKAEKRMGKAYAGPNCIFYAVDLGIAIGAAVKTAGVLGVDNRIMFSIGTAAKRVKLIDADIAFGIPLSLTGKSPYFDRVWPK